MLGPRSRTGTAGRPGLTAGRPGLTAGRPDLTTGRGRPDDPNGRAGSTHLAAVDVVRFLTIGGMVLVHCSSIADTPSLAADGVLAVGHVTRSVFLIVSAFVLTLSWMRRPAGVRSFWRRRVPLVAAPYLAWTLIYFLVGQTQGSALHMTGTLVNDVFTGGAHFHLYFLLLTLQLYLVFPALMAAVVRWPRFLAWALPSAVGFELFFTAAVHYGWRPPVLGVWFTNPDSWLPSYALYVVAGVAAARHLDVLNRWLRDHYRWTAVALAGSVGLTVVSFVSSLTWLGYGGLRASEVFQPAVAVEALAAAAALYALGLWWSERAPIDQIETLKRSSDRSFGVYLAHPLLLSAILSVAGTVGLSRALSAWPTGVIEVLVAVGLVPMLYWITSVGVGVARRTPVSMCLTGRPAAKSATR